MSSTSVNTSSGRIVIETGAEGPRHDPYGFTEITLERGDNTTTIHMGLGEWVRHNDELVIPNEPHDPNYVGAFLKITGFHPGDLESWLREVQSRCKCGSKQSYSMSGYPGETFEVCSKCGDVIASSFNELAII